MLDMKSCFFIGHREADESMIPMLMNIIMRLIVNEQVSYFYVGNYGGFDHIAASAIKQLKKQYPEITLMLVLPYHPGERSIEPPSGFDGTYYPEGLEKVPRRFAIVRANEIMAKQSDWLVAYVRHGASNSRKIFEYAKKQGTQCINMGDLLED